MPDPAPKPSEDYTVKAVCHVCQKPFYARYNLVGRAKTCTPKEHVCKRKVEKRDGQRDRVITCVENCCKSQYRRGAAAASMDNAIDPRKVLSKEEFNETWKATKKISNPEGIALRFIASTGCRLSETMLVRKEYVVWSNGPFSLVKIPTLKRKGRPQRSVHINNKGEFAKELRAWVAGVEANAPLFMVAKRTLQDRLEKVFDKVKADRASLVHIFRHTRASQLVEAGAALNYVRQQLGWTNLEMAKIYVHTNEGDISDVLGKI